MVSAIAASAALPDEAARQILPARSVLYESGLVTVYYRIDAEQRLLMGGRGPLREIESTAALSHLIDYARALWPSLESLNWTHAWSGRIAMTSDHYPHVHEPASGVLICVGYNGRGVAMATAMGAELARRIDDPRASFDMPVTSMRTIPLHAFWPLGAKAAILQGRVRDSLGV
jgi:glycine/D-amino acid oxidase-like deaminating enzyme